MARNDQREKLGHFELGTTVESKLYSFLNLNIDRRFANWN